MIKQSLNQNWFLHKNNCATPFPATIPTSVYTVLADNGQIPDPYWKGNEDVVRDVIDEDYTYTCTFSPLPELLEEDACILRFDGIDTISDVYFNDILLGQTATCTVPGNLTLLLCFYGKKSVKSGSAFSLKGCRRSLCSVCYPRL